MTTVSEQQRILLDVVNIVHRNVPEEIVRQDIYTELITVFDDEMVLEFALGEDEIYDSVFKDMINSETDAEDE
jgi:hypothetical protein